MKELLNVDNILYLKNIKSISIILIIEFYKENGLGFTVKDGKVRGVIKERYKK